jgi:hypothetical protein
MKYLGYKTEADVREDFRHGWYDHMLQGPRQSPYKLWNGQESLSMLKADILKICHVTESPGYVQSQKLSTSLFIDVFLILKSS